MNDNRERRTLTVAITGGLIVLLILVIGTFWMGQSAGNDAVKAVHSVSLLYLDELAGRREQVVASNLKENINMINVAVELLTEEDLSSIERMMAYQTRMKRLYDLDRFAFVGSSGLFYTADGIRTDLDPLNFDIQNISEPVISVKNLTSEDKRVIIAVPTDISFSGDTLIACFIESGMDRLLEGVSMQSGETDTTFCNIYTGDGIALSNVVLGGLASEDNLLEAMRQAKFEQGYTLDTMLSDFAEGRKGAVSFSYNGIRETLSYVPIENTNWFLTYLIRESVISEKIDAVSNGIVMRSLIQSILTALVLLGMFVIILIQNRKSTRILLEKETNEAENRVKQEEMEHRLELQGQLLDQEKQRTQQSNLITALASDYWSVYYIELDKNEGVCYQSHADVENGFKVGDHFNYLASVTDYANKYVTDEYREEFLHFIRPDNIREKLKNDRTVSYRYMVSRHGKETYETVRFAGIRHPEDRDDHLVHSVGACFMDVDAETRKTLAQSQALRDALQEAEQASRAKTVFLSNMSHEIRTPMNAIIGLDNIALHDDTIPDKTRGYLEKIGSSAQHLLLLINDILDMSRIESGRMTINNEEFSFSKLLEQINTMFSGQCSNSNLTYNCRVIGQPDAYYIGDNMKLRQVLINILSNAIKFTPEGGTIDFIAEKAAQFDGHTTLRFIVKDTGIGISKEFLPHIFETFSQEDSSATNKYGSSGLGLAITNSIVEMMNGKINVESEKGVGTTFTITVTLLDSNRVSASAEDIEIRPQDLSVLVIDDDPIACEHAKLVLEKVGIASESALSGPEAIEMVRLRHARRDPYKLILVDWKMPDMDGVETTRQIRKIIGNESAIIILTAYKWDDVQEEAIAAGVDSFLPKPLFAANVLEEFRDALKRKNILEPAAEKADLKGRHILLAEDMMVNAEIMIMVLEMREMEADHAENGKVALEKFAASPEGYYDAILMDMRMPEMDGLEATQRIRALNRADSQTVPIIALTANAFDEDVQRSLQAGLNAHLSKPVDPDVLYETLENFISH